ncbi:hypothetical protein BS78_05G256600 [Paspalum vaginatum]|nr:hypothetical protein BS78_05G256600 [Paspalum vaginatum]
MDDSSGFNASRSSPEQQIRASQSFARCPTPPQFNHQVPPQFNHQAQHQFPPNYNPYGMHLYPPQYNNQYEANFNFAPGMGFGRGNGSEGVLSSSPVESMVFGQGVSGSSPASPISPAPQMNTVNVEEWSDNSDEEKKGGHMNWTEEENLKLVSAWLHNSVDAIKGNSQKGQDFWKKIVAEFNSNVTTDRRRSVSQCKTHYTKTNKIVVHFNGCWIRMKQAHGSGESDDQVMEKAHALYKREAEQKPFTLVYWWKAVKDQPKWANRGENQEINTNKRVKLNGSGAYTSSNQESEDAGPIERSQLEGQKKAKAKLKGKEKCTSDLSLETLRAEKMKMYHEATHKKAEAMQKAAQSMEIAAKEKAKSEMLAKYLDLMALDTSGFDDARRQRHNNVLKYMEMKLFQEEN